MVVLAQITEINFPTRMPGEIVDGTVNLTNIGDESTGPEAGWFGVLIKTLWDGAEYERIMYAATLPGETATFDFHSLQGGIGTMPVGYAEIEVTGRTLLGDTWSVDDVKRWDLLEGAPPPLVELLLPAISSAIVGTLAVMWGLSPG